jgi:hypothetical protein
MRRQMLFFLAFAALVPLAGPVHAQFPLSPRGIVGAVTQPLRGLFGGHYHRRTERHHPALHATAPAPSTKATEAKPPENPPEPIARETAPDRANPYDVILGYTFWPKEFGNVFIQYGFGTVAAAIVGPSAGGPTADRRRQVATTGQATGSAARDFLPSCDIGDRSTSDWATGRIKRELHSQLAAYDGVRASLIEGAKAIRSRCRASKADTPLERVEELKQRIWALHDADVLARPAIKTFYQTLTDKQKAAFKTAPPPPPPANRNAAAAPMGERSQACAMAGGNTAQGLIDAIANKVRPTGEQQASLDNFGKVSAQMEKILLASCAQPQADNPLGRLDAADAHLDTISYVVSNMEIALNAFYSALADEQKANFDALGQEAAR